MMFIPMILIFYMMTINVFYTCLVYVGDDLGILEQHINEKLFQFQIWCNSNKLSLNASKSQFMVITNKVVNNYPVLSIGGNNIVRVECFKYLGVQIDNNLKFQCQVDHVKSKLNTLASIQ